MTSVPDAIRTIYAQVRAPDWAAPNLDALADVLRDLSWLPPGPVVIETGVDALPDPLPDLLLRVLTRAVVETSGTDRPVQLRSD